MINRIDFMVRIIIRLTELMVKKLPASGTLDEMYAELDKILQDDFCGRGK